MSQSSQRKALIHQTVEIDAGPGRRIEVTVLRDGSGTHEVRLRDLSFGQGLGWYPEKTIRLDAEQAEALLKALCCARRVFPCDGQPGLHGRASSRENPGEAKIVYLDPNRTASP